MGPRNPAHPWVGSHDCITRRSDPLLHTRSLDDATVRVDDDQLDGITSGACGAHPRREALDLGEGIGCAVWCSLINVASRPRSLPQGCTTRYTARCFTKASRYLR